MVSILKNQLLKHLSRYTKNLSPDKVNFSTFRGEGDLYNLELDENVLTELLELPSWMCLTSAHCNHVFFRISWTKIKSIPISLVLDEVNITIETSAASAAERNSIIVIQPASISGGKYGFVDKIIDGITVTVNSVNINFKSPAFSASIQVSRVQIESKTPKWTSGDLRLTRIKDSERDLVIIFKECSWQTLRIEAYSLHDMSLTPLRLLTNQGRCRITISKKLSDCSIVASRLVLILDDLLWVFTDSQLKAAIQFSSSLYDLIRTAQQLNKKTKAVRKNQSIHNYSLHRGNTLVSSQNFANAFNIRETSYHLLGRCIDLHFCDDDNDTRSCYPDLNKGGALQVSVKGFQFDYYPYHLANLDRTHWAKYEERHNPPALWLRESMSLFRVLCSALNSEKNYLNEISKSLMCSCSVLRIEDFCLYKVSTSKKKHESKDFIRGDKQRYLLPADMPLMHIEFTDFYYPVDNGFPLPPSKLFMYIKPIQVNYDMSSILWIHSFFISLNNTFMNSVGVSSATQHIPLNRQLPVENDVHVLHVDVKIEAIMPQISIDVPLNETNLRNRLKSMQIQVSRLTISNVFESELSQQDLHKTIQALQQGSLFFNSIFPSAQGDSCILTSRLLSLVKANNSPYVHSCNTLLIEPRDIWCVTLQPVWIDFIGLELNGHQKIMPFVDALPVTIWIHGQLEKVMANFFVQTNKTKSLNDCKEITLDVESMADIYLMAHLVNLLKVQIDHYQYMFLLRLAEQIVEIATFLSIDKERIAKNEADNSFIAACILPQIEVTLVMPTQTSTKELAVDDSKSFLPDSASVGSDLHMKNTHTYDQIYAPLDQSTCLNTFDNDEHSFTVFGHPKQMPYQLNSNQIGPNEQIQTGVFRESLTISKTEQDHHINASMKTNFTADIHSGIFAMKKSFSNLVTSFDSRIKHGSVDDASDTCSLYSNVSSESEKLTAFINENNSADFKDLAFNWDQSASSKNEKPLDVEVASEVLEESTIHPMYCSSSKSSSQRKDDLVSTVTFRLTNVEAVKESRGNSSSTRLQVSTISCEDCDVLPWDDLQVKLRSHCRVWNVAAENIKDPPSFQMRMEETSTRPQNITQIVDTNLIKSWFSLVCDIRIRSISLDLPMPTVIKLGDLFEDEVKAKPFMIGILLDDVKINLADDRHIVNTTSPLVLELNQIMLGRDTSGSICIQPQTQRDANVLDVRNPPSAYSRDNLEKRGRTEEANLTDVTKKPIGDATDDSENRTLAVMRDPEFLRKSFRNAQDSIELLLGEKSILLDKIETLQKKIDDLTAVKGCCSKCTTVLPPKD